MPEIYPPVDLAAFANTIANNPQNVSTDWDRGCYDALKAHIKDHYSILQDDICCYCRISLRFAAFGDPIEHIVPKNNHPRWMFVPKNLALACYTCNTKKRAKNTLSSTGVISATYPTNEDGFIIYHPHFNNWSDHFEIFYEFFLKPVSPKGRETFIVCELYRINLPLDKAKQRNWEEEPFRTRIIEQVLLDNSSSPELLDQCKEISKEIIRRAKRKKEILGN